MYKQFKRGVFAWCTAIIAVSVAHIQQLSAADEVAVLPAKVCIKAVSTGKYMTVDSSEWVHVEKEGDISKALVFEATLVKDPAESDSKNWQFKVLGSDTYLSYRNSTGAVKVYKNSDDALFKIKKHPTASGAFTMKNTDTKQYLWATSDTATPYITQQFDEDNRATAWEIVAAP